MTEKQMIYALNSGVKLKVDNCIKNELGFEHDEVFTLFDVLGDYEMCIIENQYGDKYPVNPKYLQL